MNKRGSMKKEKSNSNYTKLTKLTCMLMITLKKIYTKPLLSQRTVALGHKYFRVGISEKSSKIGMVYITYDERTFTTFKISPTSNGNLGQDLIHRKRMSDPSSETCLKMKPGRFYQIGITIENADPTNSFISRVEGLIFRNVDLPHFEACDGSEVDLFGYLEIDFTKVFKRTPTCYHCANFSLPLENCRIYDEYTFLAELDFMLNKNLTFLIDGLKGYIEIPNNFQILMSRIETFASKNQISHKDFVEKVISEKEIGFPIDSKKLEFAVHGNRDESIARRGFSTELVIYKMDDFNNGQNKFIFNYQISLSSYTNPAFFELKATIEKISSDLKFTLEYFYPIFEGETKNLLTITRTESSMGNSKYLSILFDYNLVSTVPHSVDKSKFKFNLRYDSDLGNGRIVINRGDIEKKNINRKGVYEHYWVECEDSNGQNCSLTTSFGAKLVSFLSSKGFNDHEDLSPELYDFPSLTSGTKCWIPYGTAGTSMRCSKCKTVIGYDSGAQDFIYQTQRREFCTTSKMSESRYHNCKAGIQYKGCFICEQGYALDMTMNYDYKKKHCVPESECTTSTKERKVFVKDYGNRVQKTYCNSCKLKCSDCDDNYICNSCDFQPRTILSTSRRYCNCKVQYCTKCENYDCEICNYARVRHISDSKFSCVHNSHSLMDVTGCLQKYGKDLDDQTSTTTLCRKCSLSYCPNCTLDYTKCNHCPDGEGLIYWDDHPTAANSSYDCVNLVTGTDFYFYNQDKYKFERCPNNCKKCTANNNCQECNIGFGLDLTSASICPKCELTYCPKCSSNYKECDFCTSEKGLIYWDTHPIAPNSTYECVLKEKGTDYYYFKASAFRFERCLDGCIECTSGSDCQKCASGKGLDLTKGSICPDCSLNYCPNCSQDYTKCNHCEDGKGLYFKDLKEIKNYECKEISSGIDSYFYNTKNFKFEKCSPNCVRCNDFTSCTSCEPTFGLNLASGPTCEKCHFSYCPKCSSDYLKCEFCPSDQGLILWKDHPKSPNSTYECIDKVQGNDFFYYNAPNFRFERCLENCLACSNSATCDICEQGYGKNPLDETECKKCKFSHCPICPSNYKKCETCPDNQGIVLWNKHPKAPNNTYECKTTDTPLDYYYYKPEIFLFELCAENCLRCESPESCSKCDFKYGKGDPEKRKQCEGCLNNLCLDCLEDNKRCLKCPEDRGIVYWESHPVKPNSTDECLKANNPPDFYFLKQESKIFERCSKHCLSCLDEKTCTNCEIPFSVLHKDKSCFGCEFPKFSNQLGECVYPCRSPEVYDPFKNTCIDCSNDYENLRKLNSSACDFIKSFEIRTLNSSDLEERTYMFELIFDRSSLNRVLEGETQNEENPENLTPEKNEEKPAEEGSGNTDDPESGEEGSGNSNTKDPEPKEEETNVTPPSQADINKKFFEDHFVIETIPKIDIQTRFEKTNKFYIKVDFIPKEGLSARIYLKNATISEDYKNSTSSYPEAIFLNKSLPKFELAKVEKKEKKLSESQEEVAKKIEDTKTTTNLASMVATTVVTISNFDVSGTVFKVIQIITLFDKLRLINIDLNNRLGRFLSILSGFFEVSAIKKNDYIQSTQLGYNKFQNTDLNSVTYRKKPDKFLMFIIAVLFDLVNFFIKRSIKKMEMMKEISLKKLEKKGKIVKFLSKINGVLVMMTIVDIFFYTGHQILHQRRDTLGSSFEYIFSYFISVILFLYSCSYLYQKLKLGRKIERIELKNIIQKNNNSGKKNLEKILEKKLDQKLDKKVKSKRNRVKPIAKNEDLDDSTFNSLKKDKEKESNPELVEEDHPPQKKLKIDIPSKLNNLEKDNFLLNFLAGGISLKAADKMVLTYNLFFVLRVLGPCVFILAFQSLPLMQILSVAMVEIFFFIFLLNSQIKHGAMSSKIKFTVKIVESFTLINYSIFCFLNLFEIYNEKNWAYNFETFVFILFLCTIFVQYLQLIILIFSGVFQLICKKNNKDKEEGSDVKENSKELVEGKSLQYWMDHEFISVRYEILIKKRKSMTINREFKKKWGDQNRIQRLNFEDIFEFGEFGARPKIKMDGFKSLEEMYGYEIE